MSQVVPTAGDEPRVRAKLPVALLLAVVAAVVMTLISVSIYYAAGFYKFDLSRPGYESERDDVVGDNLQRAYDTTSPINSDTLNVFLGEYDTNVDAVRAYGDFSDSDALNDRSLLLEAVSDEDQ